ncbi:MAG: hypothetical protein AB1797_02905 [bacterium]
MLDARSSMLDARYSILEARYSMLDARCSRIEHRAREGKLCYLVLVVEKQPSAWI